MNATPRILFGVACLVAGLVLVVLPEELVPWLPESRIAGIVLGVSGGMFLGRALQERKNAAIRGSDFKVAPPQPGKAKRRRKNKS